MLRIVALIENTSATERLKAEHGLSLYVENGGEKYLIDAGASDKLITNAKRMRIPLEQVEKILITHNHSAHTGGLEALFKLNPSSLAYARKAANDEFFVKYGLLRVPSGQLSELYEEHPERFVLYNSFQQLGEGFFAMSNEIPDYTMYSEDERLFRKDGRKLIRDDYSQEAFFVVFPDGKRERGCVIITGCAHCGIVNVLKTVRLRFPDVPIISVVGGFHMMGGSEKSLCCSPEYIDKTVNEIMAIETGAIYTCHCTGLAGYNAVKARLGDRIQYLQTGEELEF